MKMLLYRLYLLWMSYLVIKSVFNKLKFSVYLFSNKYHSETISLSSLELLVSFTIVSFFTQFCFIFILLHQNIPCYIIDT